MSARKRAPLPRSTDFSSRVMYWNDCCKRKLTTVFSRRSDVVQTSSLYGRSGRSGKSEWVLRMGLTRRVMVFNVLM